MPVKPLDLATLTDTQISNLIANHERQNAQDRPLYPELLRERNRRAGERTPLKPELSMRLLREAAAEGRCVTYGELAEANGVPWQQARHRMNGPRGHMAQLLDHCYAHGLPLLPAICVNKKGQATGSLDDSALTGFAEGARRLGFTVTHEAAFHQACQEACWEWGATQAASPPAA